MDVRCDKCQARYRIDDARVGASGLTMRCGKCGNTFKVSKDGAAASVSTASKPPPKAAPAPAADDGAGSTMMFVAPKIAPAAAPKPAPAAAAKPAAADDGAGSTMMFVAPKIAPAAAPAAAPKPAPAAARPAPAAAKPAAPASDDDAGSTMMFGTSPLKMPPAAPSAPPKPAPAAAKPAPAPVDDNSAGSTIMFGSAPIAKPASLSAKPAAPPPPKPPPPAPKKEEAPPPAARAEEDAPAADEPTRDADSDGAPETSEEPKGPRDTAEDEPGQAAPGESVGEDDVDPNALTSDASQLHGEDGADQPPAPKQPLPKAVVFGGIGAGAVIVLAVLGLLVANKFKAHPPPPEAVQALAEARAILDKDSLALFQQALDGEATAAQLAPKSPFPAAKALAAEIELAWSDALDDESALLADKSSRETDDKKKQDLDAQSQKAAADAKVHHANALEAVKGQTPDLAKSAEVHLALADYYRQSKSSGFEKELKKASALHASEGEVDFIEGVKLLGDDDGAEKALEKLKSALAAEPENARIQYRIAQAQFALKNDAEEKKALEATLKLSPGHERAKMMLDALNAANAPPPPPPSENTPENNK